MQQVIKMDKKEIGESFAMPKAVLFDWDGTLVDTMPFIREAFCTGLRDFGKEFPSGVEMDGRSLEEILKDVYGNLAEQAHTHFYETYEKITKNKVNMYAQAREFLELLGSCELSLALVSNKRGDVVRNEASALGLSEYFHSIVGAGDTQADKPSAVPLRHSLENTAVCPNNDAVWMIGDSGVDILAAHNFGCQSILIMPDAAYQDEWENENNSPSPTLQVSSIHRLKQMFEDRFF